MRIWNHPIIEIRWHDCSIGYALWGKCCPRVFAQPWVGAYMIHIFGLRIRIGDFK